MKLKAAFFEDISETTERAGRAGILKTLQRGRPGSQRGADQPEPSAGRTCGQKIPAVRIETDDLLSVGTIGLIKAVNTFNAEKGSRLATYAVKCVENAILSRMRLWFQTSIPRAEKNREAYFGTGIREYVYPLLCFGRLRKVCTYVYP